MVHWSILALKKWRLSLCWLTPIPLVPQVGFCQSSSGISLPTTYNTTQSKNDGDLWKFPSIPYKTTQAGIGGNLWKFLFATLHGQPADLSNGRGNYFLSPLHGIIPAISENAKNGRKKTGNLFLISCLGVPFYVAAVI